MFIFAAAPAEVNSTPAVNLAFSIFPFEADDFRPSPLPDFIPTAEEEAEAATLFNTNPDDFDDRTDAEWDAMAEDAIMLDRVCSGLYWS